MTEPSPECPEFSISVSKKGNEYLLRIPELHLVETNSDLMTAFKDIEVRKQRIIAEHKEAGVLDDLIAAGQESEPDVRQQKRLQIFAIKSGLVALAGVIIVSAAAFSFSYAVRESSRKVGSKIGRAAIKQVERGLEDVIKKELTTERKEKIRVLVSEAAPHLKPYIRELRPLFIELCQPSG